MELILIKNKKASLTYDEMDTNFRVLYTKPTEVLQDVLTGYEKAFPMSSGNDGTSTESENMWENFLKGYLKSFSDSSTNTTNTTNTINT